MSQRAPTCYLRRRSTNVDTQDLGIAGGNNTGSVLIAIRVDIIVRESIALAVSLVLVNNAAVVVGWVVLVVGRGGKAGLDVATIDKESGAGEGSTETGNDRNMSRVVAAPALERSAVAAPDILSIGLGVRTVVTIAVELVTRHSAVDLARSSLGVDGQRSRRVLAPDLVDIVGPVVLEGRGVELMVQVRRQDTDGSSSRVGNAHGVPGTAISVLLGVEISADLGDSVSDETGCGLGAAVTDSELHTKDHANKVDVADVGVQAVVGVSKLDEAKVDSGVGILKVGDGRLDKTIAIANVHHEELQVALSKVNAAGAEGNGKGEVEGLALGLQRNGKVLGDLDGGLGTTRAGIDQLALSTDEDDVSIRVQTLDVSVDLATGEVVDELHWEIGLDSGSRDDDAGLVVVEGGCVEGVFLSDDDIVNATGMDLGESRRGDVSANVDGKGSGHGNAQKSGQNGKRSHVERRYSKLV